MNVGSARMSHSNGAILLPELLESLFHLLLDADYGDTLGNCMLVCQSWLLLCYPLRFRRFAFKGLVWDANEDVEDEDYRRGGKIDRPPRPRHTFGELLEFLTASPRLCSYITDLRLETEFVTQRQLRCGNASEDESTPMMVGLLDVQLLWQIIALLPRLHILDLAVESLNFPDSPPLVQPFHDIKLERLSIQHRPYSICRVPSEKYLLYFLQSFRAIRHLVLRVSVDNVGAIPPSGDRAERCPVEELTLRRYRWSELRNFLDPDHLAVLDIRDSISAEHALPMDIFGRNLREIRIATLSYEDRMRACIDMRHCPKVATVQLHFALFLNTEFLGLPETGYVGWDHACEMISDASPALRDLCFVFEFYSFRKPMMSTTWDIYEMLIMQLDRIQWSGLEAALKNHPSLERLRMRIAFCESNPPAELDKDIFTKTATDYILHRYSHDGRIQELLQFDSTSPSLEELA